MNTSSQSNQRYVARLRREVYVWRFLILLTFTCGLLAASPQSQKEIRLTSSDGKNTVLLSAKGLTLQSGGHQLAQLTFETVGDGEKHVALLKLSGGVTIDSGVIALTAGKQRAMMRADGFSLNEEGVQRVTIAPGLLSLTDSGGHSKAELTADEQGMSGLTLLYNQKLIAELGSFGKFRAIDPPKRDSAALLLNDFGPGSNSRLITPSEDTIRGK